MLSDKSLLLLKVELAVFSIVFFLAVFFCAWRCCPEDSNEHGGNFPVRVEDTQE